MTENPDEYDERTSEASEPAVEVSRPRTLRITVRRGDEMRDAALAKLREAAAGDAVEPADDAVRAFESVSEIRELLTDRRVEVLRAVHDDPPDSITALAKRLDRAYSAVHDDVSTLADYGVVNFRTGPHGSRQPYVPYRAVRVDVPLIDDTPDADSPLLADAVGDDTIGEAGGTAVETSDVWLDDAEDPRTA
jgi:predicted transcriptional regulator